MFGCLESPAALLKAIRRNPNGAIVELEGVQLEFGGIAGLIPHLDPERAFWPFDCPARSVHHLDNISADRKRTLERLHGLDDGSLAGQRSRADVLVILANGRSLILSVKDDETTAKLGQVSARTTYGGATLDGGLDLVPIPAGLVPKIMDHSATALSADRFAKLGKRDRDLAYIKHNHRLAWAEIVDQALADGVDQTRRLTKRFTHDRESFISFVREVMAGSSAGTGNLLLLCGTHLIPFDDVVEALRSTDITIESEEYRTSKKTSHIVWVTFGAERYCFVKIEAAFDGASPAAEQTKGIIYYFQQHLREGNHYKKLFADLTQKS